MYDPDDDEEIEVTEADREMFTIEGVKFEMKQNVRRRQMMLVMIAPEDVDWNLMRFYLALDYYKTKMENEMGVMPEAPDEH